MCRKSRLFGIGISVALIFMVSAMLLPECHVKAERNDLGKKNSVAPKVKKAPDKPTNTVMSADLDAMRRTLDRLEKSEISSSYPGSGMSLRLKLNALERLEDFELRFHIEDESLQNLSVRMDQPKGIPLGKYLTIMLDQCGCEFAVLPDGSILIKRKPAKPRQNAITPLERSLLPEKNESPPVPLHENLI